MGIGTTITNFLAGGVTDMIESVALEWIQTDLEKAQAGKIDADAKAVMLKTMDPNGKMRRDLSRFACRMYGFYLVTTVILIAIRFGLATFDIGNINAIEEATSQLTELFLPITGAWATIVSASFGVNATNSIKGI